MNKLKKIDINLLLLATSIFLVGVGQKWNLIEYYGLDIATRDAWGAIAKQTLVPWVNGSIDYWDNFWTPWVSHQIGWGRIWSIFLTNLCGHWDNQFICSINIFIPCCAAIVILYFFKNVLNNLGILIVPIVLVATLSTRASYENTIESFQFVFYLGIFLSLLSIFLINVNNFKISSLGFFILALGIMSMAFTPALCISLILTILICDRIKKIKRSLVIYKISLLLIALFISGLFIAKSRKVDYTSSNISDVFVMQLEIFAFPIETNSPLFNFISSLIILCPTFIFFVFLIYNRKELIGFEVRALLTLLFFSISSMVIVSIFRSSLDVPSRYADLNGILLVSNSIVLAFLSSRLLAKHKPYFHFLSITWTSLVLFGYSTNQYDDKYFEAKKTNWDNRIIANTKCYIDTHGRFFNKNQKLPNTFQPHLDEVLFDKKFSKLLPPSIRDTVPIFLNSKGIKNSIHLPNDKELHYQRKHILLNSKNNLDSSNSRTVKNDKNYSFLRFTYRGNMKLQTKYLFLVSDTNTTYPIKLSSADSERWKTTNFYIPENIDRFKIISNIKRPGQWLALKEPVEVSLESWISRKARKVGNEISIVGFISLIFVLSWRCRFITFNSPH